MELLYRHTARKQEERIAALEKQNADKLTAQQMLETQNTEMRAAMAKMATMMRQLTVHAPQLPPTSTITNRGEVVIQGGESNEIKIDNSKHITINVFGQEKLDHITQRQIHQILTGTKAFALPDAATQAVLETAMLVYSDPDHPENLTCYLPNKKLGDVLVHGGSGWEIKPVQLVLPPMMQQSVDLLFDKQPREGLRRSELEACGEVLKELATCEKDLRKVRQLAGPDGSLRAVLIRNKDQLTRILEKLPVAGQN